ncbi:hypothetical protein TanjilG_01603 [Lupinus angustifolius]|nr:hypothetical protein TanjilG_01603 [Lupinus angustifolius]
MSPRISFSHDFSQSDAIPVEIQQHPLKSNSYGLNSSIDFDFCVKKSSHLESSSADELFCDGIILPIEIKKKNIVPPPHVICHNASTNKNLKKKCNTTKEMKEFNDEKHISNSFWKFKRSSSCSSGYVRSLCPLPLLYRSNSTGSTSPNVKIKQSSLKQFSTTTRFSQTFGPNNYQKPPLKSHRNNGANSIRVTPVLNVLPVNIIGLCSIFSKSKDKIKKK